MSANNGLNGNQKIAKLQLADLTRALPKGLAQGISDGLESNDVDYLKAALMGLLHHLDISQSSKEMDKIKKRLRQVSKTKRKKP